MNSLKKEERIKSRSEMRLLFEEGSSLKAYPIKLLWYIDKKNSPSIKAAFAAPKRSFRKAVTRNLIKRRLKEAYRLNRSRIDIAPEGGLLLMFVIQGTDIPSFQELQDKIILLLQRLSTTLQKEKEL